MQVEAEYMYSTGANMAAWEGLSSSVQHGRELIVANSSLQLIKLYIFGITQSSSHDNVLGHSD